MRMLASYVDILPLASGSPHLWGQAPSTKASVSFLARIGGEL